MTCKGETWNESEVCLDPLTLRKIRQITTVGQYNVTPTYHTNTGFTADGEFLIFASARLGRSAIFRCHVPTGDITQLIDWVDGIGFRDELCKPGVHWGTDGVGDGRGVSLSMCIAPRSHWAVFVVERSIRAVHIETLEERILIEDIGADQFTAMPSVDPDETYVIVPVQPVHPELCAGNHITKDYLDFYGSKDMYMRLLEVPLSGGEVTTVYEEEGIGCCHCAHCPTDPDLLLIDRDLSRHRQNEVSRIWILCLSTGELTELPPRDKNPFQVHSAWTWDGQNVIYHGQSAKGGWYIGVVDRKGQTVREYGFHRGESYGHISAMAGRPAIILDGNITPDMLLWLYYDQELPRIEIIARHGTNLMGMPWQYSHPHPLSDLTGRWISFNAVRGQGRSDIFIVEV